MMNNASTSDSENGAADVSYTNGDGISFEQAFVELNNLVPYSEAFVVSSLPRAGLQIVQPARFPESFLRSYSRDLHAYDQLTWRTIDRNATLRASDAWDGDGLKSSRFNAHLMHANGLLSAAAAPLRGPVFDGYPGALHIYRRGALGDFTDVELQRLGTFAGELDQACSAMRASRRGDCGDVNRAAPASRIFVLDVNLRSLLSSADPSQLDEHLRENMFASARRRFEHVNGRAIVADREMFADSNGDFWTFRVAMHQHYPALSNGPIVFFCLQPSCADWSIVRPSDIIADAEMARLLPAVKFMQTEFSRGTMLGEIARTVHLSPFHFHRRFTELMGITPKNFLLDCQIQHAKGELMAHQKELAGIAKDCGFAHQSHFTSRFKQATGLTPTRWRRLAMRLRRDATAT